MDLIQGMNHEYIHTKRVYLCRFARLSYLRYVQARIFLGA